ncbi:MAG: hypothetical protein ACTSU5_20700 [Promethearchaeota archaeon]
MVSRKIKIVVVSGLVSVVLLAGFWRMIFPNNSSDGEGGDSFDPGDRYDDSALDEMGVIFKDANDICGFSEGFSTTESCPWGFVHLGIDFFFSNGSQFVAASPGQVIGVDPKQNERTGRYQVGLAIRFNTSVILNYNMECFSDLPEDADRQIAMLNVSVGTWVVKGQYLGTFLKIGSGAHVHFDVIEDEQKYCLEKYYGAPDLAELVELVHSYHPTWDVCYS